MSEYQTLDYKIEFPSLSTIGDALGSALNNPSIYFGFSPGIRYTWIVDLRKDKDKLLSDCEKTTRQEIRRFNNQNRYVILKLSSKDPSIIEELISMSVQTYIRSNGIPKSKEYYHQLFYNTSDDHKDIYFIYDTENNRIVVYALIVKYDKKAHYSLGASIIEKPSGISKYLFYNIILDLKIEGYQLLEMGGAYPYLNKYDKRRGISDFKKCFGSVLYPIHQGFFVE